MNQLHLIKYKKIRDFRSKQLELVKQRIAAQQQKRRQLEQQNISLREQMQIVEQQFEISSTGIANHQQCSIAIVDIQQKINVLQKQIVAASDQLKQLFQAYREQDRQLKSWEKLVDQETEKIAHAAQLLEMRIADDRYLGTQFAGEQR